MALACKTCPPAEGPRGERGPPGRRAAQGAGNSGTEIPQPEKPEKSSLLRRVNAPDSPHSGRAGRLGDQPSGLCEGSSALSAPGTGQLALMHSIWSLGSGATGPKVLRASEQASERQGASPAAGSPSPKASQVLSFACQFRAGSSQGHGLSPTDTARPRISPPRTLPTLSLKGLSCLGHVRAK